MPADYDAVLRTIDFKELSPVAEQTTESRNGQINNYQCEACAGQIDGGDFISVIDAIPGDGMNPLWEEQQITFNDGFTPRQFFSDDEVLAAQASGEITITDTDTDTDTDETYRCSVVGAK